MTEIETTVPAVLTRSKTLPVEDSLACRIKYMAQIFGITNESTIDLLLALYEANTGQPVTLNKYNREFLSKSTGLTVSAINTSLHRLSKDSSGVITYEQKTIYFHPAFGNLHETAAIIIKFTYPVV